jgi:hypothetical protein
MTPKSLSKVNVVHPHTTQDTEHPKIEQKSYAPANFEAFRKVN